MDETEVSLEQEENINFQQLEDQQLLAKRKQTRIRTGAVALIVLVVAGIFLYESFSGKNTENTSNVGSSASETIPLKVSSVDLETLKSYNIPIVIDFGSDSCIPCQQMAPVLETLNEEWQGKAIVQFVDVWEYTTAAADFPVSVIPTQIFFNADRTPYVPSDSILESMGFTMYSDKTTGAHVFTVHQGGVTEEQMRQIFAEMGIE